MKQLKIMGIVFAVLFVAVLATKAYFAELASDLRGPLAPSPVSAEEPSNPGTEQEGLLIELE